MKLLLQRWWLTRRRRRWRRVDALETLYRSSGVSLKRPLAKQKFVVIDCDEIQLAPDADGRAMLAPDYDGRRLSEFNIR